MRTYFETIGVILTLFAFAYLVMSICSGTFDFQTWNFNQRYWFGFTGGFLPLILGIAFIGIKRSIKAKS